MPLIPVSGADARTLEAGGTGSEADTGPTPFSSVLESALREGSAPETHAPAIASVASMGPPAVSARKAPGKAATDAPTGEAPLRGAGVLISSAAADHANQHAPAPRNPANAAISLIDQVGRFTNHVPDGTDGADAAEGDRSESTGVTGLPSGVAGAPGGTMLDAVAGADPAMFAAFVPVAPGSDPTDGAAIAVPVTEVESRVTLLREEFRDRLERVIERMESEFGYRVEVVETIRSQDRQDALFRQGRIAPGPVVTWTRSSRHTDGLAADLMVDGTYSNPLAYDRLAQIAREEGLRTLGPRDAGHVELASTALVQRPGPAGAVSRSPDAQSALPGSAALQDRMSDESHTDAKDAGARSPDASPWTRVARIAPVARVADVAPVSRIARVAPAAEIASVGPMARVASVAPVAEVAQVDRVTNAPHLLMDGARQSAPAGGRDGIAAVSAMVPAAGDREAPTPSPRPMPATAVAAAPEPKPMASEHGGAGDRGRRSRDERSPERAPTATERLGSSVLRAFDNDSRARVPSPDRAERMEQAPATTAVDRISQLLALRDSAAERPLSSVVLRLDRPDGGEDRVRVDLRGNGVGAAFDMTDAGLAEDLGRHVAELARSLERQGLDADSVIVRTLAAKDTPATASQALAGERDALRAATAGNAGSGNAAGRHSRGNPNQSDHPHDEPGRQRPRRDSRGDR